MWKRQRKCYWDSRISVAASIYICNSQYKTIPGKLFIVFLHRNESPIQFRAKMTPKNIANWMGHIDFFNFSYCKLQHIYISCFINSSRRLIYRKKKARHFSFHWVFTAKQNFISHKHNENTYLKRARPGWWRRRLY